MRGMLKRACLTTLILAAALLCMHSSAGAKVHSGKWKNNTTWYYDTKTKTVTIACRGKMYEKMSGMGCAGDWQKWYREVKRVVFKPGITYIASFAFYNFSELEEVSLPEGLVSIGAEAFWCCPKLKRIIFPSTLREIDNGAFNNTGIEEASLRNLEVIGAEAFCGTGLKRLTIGGTLEMIDFNAFAYCNKLKSVTICDGVRKIGQGMFGISAFRSVTIPASVTEIKKYAFYSYTPKDSKLQNVVIRSTKIKKWGKEIFGKARKDLVIRVPKSKKREYTKALRKGGLPEYVKIVGE